MESPKGKETASELADEANETGSGNAIPSSEGGAASSGASVEASEPEMTKSAKKRQRKAEAKAALRGMKTLIGDVKQGMAEKKQREAAREGDATSTEPEPETAPEPVPERDAVPEAHRSRRSLDEKTPASSPPRETPPPPDEKRVTRNAPGVRSRNPYATATESAAASALPAEAHAAYAERRTPRASTRAPPRRRGVRAADGAARARATTQALAALRAAAAAPGAATFAAQETREMAAALGRLFVTSAAAPRARPRGRVARVAFPTPDGWFEPGRREETVAPLAARRLIPTRARRWRRRPARAGPGPFTRGEGERGRGETSRRSAAAWPPPRRPCPAGAGASCRAATRRRARLSGAVCRRRRRADGVAASSPDAGRPVPDPLEAVAESEWALASEPGVDETFAEEARGVVVAAAAEACADRVVAAVAARVPSAESLEKSRFEPDAPERGRGYPKPPAALVSALRALVGCVSATGASGAEAAHGALYRAADAVWALCLDGRGQGGGAAARHGGFRSDSARAAALASAAARQPVWVGPARRARVLREGCVIASRARARGRGRVARAPGESDARDPRDAGASAAAANARSKSPGWD